MYAGRNLRGTERRNLTMKEKVHYILLMAWENEHGEIVYEHDTDLQEALLADGSSYDMSTYTWFHDHPTSEKIFIDIDKKVLRK